eukprot:9501823-Pyramimonas_sp.AAC.1
MSPPCWSVTFTSRSYVVAVPGRDFYVTLIRRRCAGAYKQLALRDALRREEEKEAMARGSVHGEDPNNLDDLEDKIKVDPDYHSEYIKMEIMVLIGQVRAARSEPSKGVARASTFQV